MLESAFQAKLLRALRQRMPHAVIQKWPADMTSKGMPDLMISSKGLVTWLECKTERGELSQIQYETLKRLMRGYLVEYKQSHYRVSQPGWGSEETSFARFEELIAHLEKLCRND